MKRNKSIIGLIFATSLFFGVNSFAQEIVCIDPGHGGPSKKST